MKNKSYQDVANEIVDILKSNKSIEEQEKNFKDLVEKEEKAFLFSATIGTVLNTISKLEPEETINVLNKFLVNSMMNGIITLGENCPEFNENVKKEFVKNFIKNMENKNFQNREINYLGGQIVDLVTWSNYFFDFSESENDIPSTYYLKKIDIIKEASKEFNKMFSVAGTKTEMANLMVKGLYSIFNSRYGEEEKNKIFKERIAHYNSGLYPTVKKDGRLVNDDVFKLDSPVFSNELSSFVKNINNGESFYNEVKIQLTKNNIELNDMEIEKQELKDHTESIKSALKSDNSLKK
jgi:hypothetical protein